MEIALGIVVGIAISCLFLVVMIRKSKVGVLRVDESDPYDQPCLFAELTMPISFVRKRKFVVMRVLDESYLPAKKSSSIMDKP